jgi:hypothetical protein
MPSWKKVILSGSDATLNSLNVTTSLTASGFIYPTIDGDFGVEVIKTDGSGNLELEIPQTVYEFVKNVSGGTLPKGTPVHSVGTAGFQVEVVAADAGDPSTMPATFILNQNLDDEEEGLGIAIGAIKDVDTTGLTAGDAVYVAVGGGFTQTKPTGSALIQNLGIVTKVGVNGGGVVLGAGRSNDIPNLPPDTLWVGNEDGVGTPFSASNFYTGSYTGSFIGDGSGLTNLTVDTSNIVTTSSFNEFTSSYSTGSFTGSFTGDGSGLTGIGTTAFPFTGSAEILGSLGVSGSVRFGYACDVILGASGTWTTGGNLITARFRLGGAGTQNEGLAFGGYTFVNQNVTEEYNGASWSAGGNLITARQQLAGAGTQNSGLAFGGCTNANTTATEEYSGVSWASGGSLINGRRQLAGAGTQNSGLAFGGFIAAAANCTEEYDGTSWTTGGNLSTARYGLGGAGTQNSGLAFGGVTPITNTTEEYNGTSWSAGGNLITARRNPAGAGTQNSGLAFGGATPTRVSCTEQYDGTSWSTGGNLSTARYQLAGAGSQGAGLAFGGFANASSNATEEYTKPVIGSTYENTFDYSGETGQLSASGSFSGSFTGDGSGLTGIGTTAFPFTGSAEILGSLGVSGSIRFGYACDVAFGSGTWSAGGNLITARRLLAGAGTQNSGLAFGGATPTIVSCTEEYNGISWTTGGNLSTARYGLGGAGTQNSGLAFGGLTPANSNATEEYNGTSWSIGGNLITARFQLAGAGTQNEGLAFGGATPTIVSCTEEYNGTSWASGGNLITARRLHAGAGTQNSGLAFGGTAPTISNATEEYNGTTWSTGGNLSTARFGLAGAGTQNSGLTFGGRTPATVSCTEEYNGISWTTGGNLSTARYGLGGAGTQNSGLAFGGFANANSNATEAYTKPLIETIYEKTFDYSGETGFTTVSCLIETSAQRYKENIQPLPSQLANILKLQPVEFDWKGNNRHDIGFVAEMMRDVYPNLVTTNKEGVVEGMNYTKLVSALVKSIQEQQEQINNLTNEINKIKNKN